MTYPGAGGWTEDPRTWTTNPSTGEVTSPDGTIYAGGWTTDPRRHAGGWTTDPRTGEIEAPDGQMYAGGWTVDPRHGDVPFDMLNYPGAGGWTTDPRTGAPVGPYPGAGGWTTDPRTGAPVGPGGFGGGNDYTTPDNTRFNGLPGHPEVWKNSDDGKTYIVYQVPGIEPPIPLLFTVNSDEDLASFFGNVTPKVDQTFSQQQIDSFGSMLWGSTDTIPDKEGDPFAGLVERMTRAMEVQPWLEDDEVWATYAGAWLEDRPVEEWELAATDYWQGLNQAERQYIQLHAADPQEAARLMETNKTIIADMFRDLGVEGVDNEIIGYMAGQLTRGTWSPAYLQEQVWVTTGSPSNEAMDGNLRSYLTDNNMNVPGAVFMDTDVKAMFTQWLGPKHPPTDTQVKEWAAKMRRSPEQTRDDLTEMLRGQRLSLFPEYENPALTYEDIAAPWRSFQQNMWGQRPDETDPTFLQVLRMNDATEAGKLLRREGLNRNIGAVKQSMIQGIEAQSQRVVNPI